MDHENNRRFESVYSSKVRAGKRRTYFFDVRRTKGDDFYVTLTESTRRYNDDGYERHKIFLYKEDFNRFVKSLEDCINHVKTELMPDYDYDEFTRRQEEWEARKAAGEFDKPREETPSDSSDVSDASDSSDAGDSSDTADTSESAETVEETLADPVTTAEAETDSGDESAEVQDVSGDDSSEDGAGGADEPTEPASEDESSTKSSTKADDEEEDMSW